MVIIASVIVKVLYIVDNLLGEWVSVSAVNLHNACGDNFNVLDASVTECGGTFLAMLNGLVNNGLFLVNDLLAGVMAI